MISLGHSTALNLSRMECLNECTTQPSLTNGFNHLLRTALAELAFASSPSLYLGNAYGVVALSNIFLAAHSDAPTSGTLR